jgi:putative nucleotidyltransferase with HDIG domain
MKVQIDVGQLEIGMYVCELDRPWRETPLPPEGFHIRSDADIRALRRYCRTVSVLRREFDPGARVDPPRDRRLPVTRQQALALDGELFKLNNHPSARSVYADQATFEQELAPARDAYRAARLTVNAILEDARLGRSPDVPGARRAVGAMVASVLRNPDALGCFAQLRRKDEYTAQHSLRVCVLALIFGRQLGLPLEQLGQLGIGALLHDVGKVRIPQEILNKPGELTAAELEIVKDHVRWGVEILEPSGQVPAAALEVVRGHHERYDGSGYAAGLKGEAIDSFAMIGAIVDHYDAITSDRAYRAAVSAHAALKSLYEARDRLFERTLVERFIQCLGIYPIGSVVELNTGELGVVAALDRGQRLKPQVVLVRHADGSAFSDAPMVRLAARRTPQGKPCEIERVLEPSVCGIDPVRYLPVAAVP